LPWVQDLPTGTVTFLFTDVEGSTALLKQLGRDRYHEVLAQHERLLRAAIAAHEGRVVDTQGDSFFAAFRTAADAVAAAVDAQRDLAVATWPDGAEVKVRMGLHTGEPRVGEERYVGIGVHRAARIGAAGHGGQVLLSSTTKELAEEELPSGVTIRDLGERRLKDIDQPQRIYQLDVEGLPSEFAQLKTLDVELRRKRRRMYAGAALIGVLAAAVAVPVFAFGQGSGGGGITVSGNQVAEIDPGSNRVVGSIAVGARPGAIASGSDSLWVANLDDKTVQRIDLATGKVVHTVPVQDSPTGLATSPGNVWAVGSNATTLTVRQIDPRYNAVTSARRIASLDPRASGSVAARGAAVWVAPAAGLLTRLDPRTSRVTERIDPNASPSSVAVGGDAVWVADSEAATVTRVDPTGLLEPIAVGHSPSAVAAGAGAVWVADTLDDAVTRINPATRLVVTTIGVGGAPEGVATGAGSVWVANSRSGTVTRIDPSTNKPVGTIHVGGSPQQITVADGRVWVTVDAPAIQGSEAARPGGIARVNSLNPVDSMDPGLAFNLQSWQLLEATCAQLLNYPDKPAPAGSRLEPEVAQSLPARSRDGKTYTFTIRKGFRFSPPSNEPVTAQAFKYSIERSLSPKLGSGAQGYLGDVVGAGAYMAGKARHIAGVTAHGDTLTIRLVKPAPDFVTRLSVPFFCAVPLGTPIDPGGVRVVPSAGPYYVTSYVPGQSVDLRRNPSYRGDRPHRLKGVHLVMGVSQQKTLAQIKTGAADYALDGVPARSIPGLRARFGPGTRLAAKGRQQFFSNPQQGLLMLAFNTRRPLFQSLRARRAVNYAIDRTALARLGVSNSPDAEPTDQYLPPGVPGFRRAHVYPFTPQVDTARRLLAGRGGTAVLYTCNATPCDQIAQVVKRNLAAIGIAVEINAFPTETLYAKLKRKGEPVDLAAVGWLADYPDPADFLNLPLEHPQSYGLLFHDAAAKRRLDAAAKLTGAARYLAYGRLDAELARTSAPWAAYANPVSFDLFSARMGCQVFQPAYAFMDLAALCIRR
jgi:YVTN family beta-propeller protein